MKNKLLISIFYFLLLNNAIAQNNALHFDGVDDYVELPKEIGNFDFDEDFTISIWVKPAIDQPDIEAINNDFLEKMDNFDPFPFLFSYLNKKAGNEEGHILVQRFDGRVEKDGKAIGNPTILSTIKINDGKWHNIIFIKDSVDLKLFIDGKPAGNTIDDTIAKTKNNSPIFIGKRGSSSNYFKGEIDELHIWDYANYEAIQNIYKKFPSYDGLVASYSFDEGFPSEQNDSETILHNYFQFIDGTLHNFKLEGNESNFVENPTVLIDTTVATITIESPIGIENGKKSTSDGEVPIIGLVNSIAPIVSVFINEIEANEKFHTKKFNKTFKLKNGENKIKILAIDKYGKKTEQTFTITKESAQNSLIAKQLPKIEAGRRVALVIGNAEYLNFDKLKNPINDAKLLSNQLGELGFIVDTLFNASKKQITYAIASFKKKLQIDSTTTGLFYFAGHGIQDSESNNYIVPVEAKAVENGLLFYENYEVDRLLLNLEQAKNSLNIIILDACRKDPKGRSASGERVGGLALKHPPEGVYIAYATGPGQIAEDGKGKNSPYTEALVNKLKEPRLKIEEVFKATKEEVRKITNKKQIPWDRQNIIGEFYFNVK